MKIKWNSYTWYSKMATILVLILAIPVVAYYIGAQYQDAKEDFKRLDEPTVVDVYESAPATTTASSTNF